MKAYDLAKALLNSIYGMMAQDPVKQDTIFNGVDFEQGPEDLEGKLAANSKKAFTSYAWGCWCTSWARLRLWEGIELAGRDFCYCDTDSVKALGAKKYAYVQDGQLHITIAGVGKKRGARELEEAGGLKAFRPGMIFRAAGGTESIYNNLTREVITIDGRQLELGPNIYIRESTYTLGITQEYGEPLADPASYLELLSDRDNFADFEHEFN